jgi:MazG family protein
MLKFPEQEFRKLWTTLERLLAPDGCPWDRKQGAVDISRYIIEECHEWREAIEDKNPAHQAEELGDLSYLLLFALQKLASEENIPPGEALRLVDEKLRRRHPDIFGDAERTASIEEQIQRWDAIKREERGEQSAGLLKRLPSSMSALAKAHRYQDKAATVGFDWPELTGVIAKLREETRELEEVLEPIAATPTPDGEGSPSSRFRKAVDPDKLHRIRDEIGDLFFVLSNLCRWTGMDAEEVAEAANTKFLHRFAGMEKRLAEAGSSMEEADLEEMEAQWQAFKAESRHEPDA